MVGERDIDLETVAHGLDTINTLSMGKKKASARDAPRSQSDHSQPPLPTEEPVQPPRGTIGTAEADLSLVRRASGRTEWTFVDKDAPAIAEMSKVMRALRSVSELSGADPETYWWWITDSALKSMGAQLQERHFCILDGMLSPQACGALRGEVTAVREGGKLSASRLAGGRDGQKLMYSHSAVRGDHVGW